MRAPPATSASLVEDDGLRRAEEGMQINNPEAMAESWRGFASMLSMRFCRVQHVTVPICLVISKEEAQPPFLSHLSMEVSCQARLANIAQLPGLARHPERCRGTAFVEIIELEGAIAVGLLKQRHAEYRWDSRGNIPHVRFGRLALNTMHFCPRTA